MSNPPPVPQKKGLSGLAVVGIGCLGLIVIAFLGGGILVAKYLPKLKEVAGDFEKDPAKAATLLALKMNPDVEILSTDDAKREVTFKTKADGKTTTVSFDEFEKGKITVKNDKGEEYSFDATKAQTDGVVIKSPDGQTVMGGSAAATAPPAWVPKYPGLVVQDGGLRTERPDGTVSGVTAGKIGAALAQVREHYETELKKAGFEVTHNATEDGKAGTLTATKDAGKTTVSVTLSSESEGETQVALTYEGPKS